MSEDRQPSLHLLIQTDLCIYLFYIKYFFWLFQLSIIIPTWAVFFKVFPGDWLIFSLRLLTITSGTLSPVNFTGGIMSDERSEPVAERKICRCSRWKFNSPWFERGKMENFSFFHVELIWNSFSPSTCLASILMMSKIFPVCLFCC